MVLCLVKHTENFGFTHISSKAYGVVYWCYLSWTIKANAYTSNITLRRESQKVTVVLM
jgi:hypothetical protein